MDREQEEMQFLGLFGIYAESCKIIRSWRRIFSQITLALILPLSFIFLTNIEVSHLILSKIIRNGIQLDETPSVDTSRRHKLSDLISSERTSFWIFEFFYFTFLLVFSLLSTSAVVYTIASVYTARDVTFRRVLSVVPKVWKRLMVTFLCTFSAFFSYNIVAAFVVVVWILTVGISSWLDVVIPIVLYLAGLVYMTIVWQLASVVSVLEDLYGLKAMVKSMDLISGKTWIAVVIFFKLILSLASIRFLFRKFVVSGYDTPYGILGRFGFGMLCFLLLSMLFLFGLVIQTVFYFVCKSYHHENIDKSSLSDHLEVYIGEYVPLKAKDVQLEQFDV